MRSWGGWGKLRRRKVVEWGLAYAAGAWALLQVIGFAADTFDWPRQIQQFASIGLAVGLPVVLVIAWYHGDRGQQRVSGAELAILSVLLALGGGALWLYGKRNEQVPAARRCRLRASEVPAMSLGGASMTAAGVWTMPTLPLTGGCFCEALRYRISAPPLCVYNCHCTNCQRIGGAAFATNVVVTPESFEFVRGDPRKTSWKSDAGTERFGWFCGDCGGRILHGHEVIPLVTVRSGTLDDTSWVTPVGDVWTRSARPWVQFAESRLICERQPTDLGPYVEAFRALGISWK